MTGDVAKVLQGLTFTRDLGAADIERLASLAQPLTWSAGQTVFREGDCDNLLYLVAEGQVAIEIAVPPRGRVRILTVGSGEVFGWSSLHYRKPKTASATAIEPTRALAFDAGRLREWSDSDPRFGYWLTSRLLQVVSERLKVTRFQLLDVFKG